MFKATAKANANIALVKYWGKGDDWLKLPVNSSVSIGLEGINTFTTVEFDEKYSSDEVEIDGENFNNQEKQRVVKHLDLIRNLARIKLNAKVVTANNFPKASGAASSASGFAALTVAAAAAAGLNLSQKELSIIARQGSGSACRSIPGGFCVWHKGENNDSSYAELFDHPKEWDLKVLLVFVGNMSAKKIGSSEAMALTARTSPYYSSAIIEAEKNVDRLREAMTNADWKEFGRVIEDECFRLHTLCMTTTPNILYWSGETVSIFQRLYELRERGVEAFFTVDAGPHVHIICKNKDVAVIKNAVKDIDGIINIVECGIGGPARIIEEHLF